MRRTTKKQGSRKKPATTIATPLSRTAKVKRFLALLTHASAYQFRAVADRYSIVYRATGAVAITAPPYLLLQYYQISDFSSQIKKDWPVIAAILDNHVVLGVVLAGAWGFFVISARRLLLSITQDGPDGWDAAPIYVLKALDHVVGEKQHRFSMCLQELSNSDPNTASKADIFGQITQPDLQLKELVKGIYSCFDALLNDVTKSKQLLKVNLAMIGDDGSVRSILYHHPRNHPVRSPISALNEGNSTIKIAATTRKIVVVESIFAEVHSANPRFVVTNAAYSNEDGSLICYPVVQEGIDSVVFVISIFVDLPNTFKQKYGRAYNELLLPFALRFKLEHALFALKEMSK